MKVYIPDMKRVPENATQQERVKMFEDYKKELIRQNPHLHNKDGSRKSFWEWLWG